MKKIGILSLSLMLVALVTGSALAEIPAGFSLSGGIDAPYTYRSKEINTFLNGGGLTSSDFLLSPLVIIDTKWETKGKVLGAVRFQNYRLTNTTAVPAALGTTNPCDFGAGVNINPAISQAYIKVAELFSPKLTMTYGIQDLQLTLRKGEGAFFMHPAGSLTPSGQLPLDMNIAMRGLVACPTRVKGASEFSGFNFNYGSMKDENYAVEVFWGKTMETSLAVGAKRNEDLLFGVNVDYKLPGDNNVAKVLLSKFNNPSTNMDIMTIGVGADYFGATPNLELYGEVYMQSGTASNNGNNAAGKPCDVDQAATAFRLGGRYDIANNPLKPWAGLSYWAISGGDDSSIYKKGSVKYTENNHFISYEDFQSTLILEDSLWGLNLNSNYTAIKIEGGITTSLTLGGEKTDVDLRILFGMFSFDTVPYIRNAGPDGFLYVGADDTVDKSKTGIGTEIDIVAILHYTENLSFTLGLGMLSGSDFFGGIDVDNTNNSATKKDTDNFDSMTLVTIGLNLKF